MNNRNMKHSDTSIPAVAAVVGELTWSPTNAKIAARRPDRTSWQREAEHEMVPPGARMAKRAKGRIPARGRSMLWSNPTTGARCSGSGVCHFRNRCLLRCERRCREIEKHEPQQLLAACHRTPCKGCLCSHRLR